jgi:RNA polymerase sigma-70 factor (ECF subfamily)
MSLISRLRRWDNQESWQDFFNTYWRLIFGAAKKAGLRDDEAEEVVQETVIKVAKKMDGFTYDPKVDSFKGWLLWLTRKGISDQYRKRKRAEGGKGLRPKIVPLTDALESKVESFDNDLGTIWDQEWKENLFKTALARIREKVAPKQYQMFDYYALKQWPVEKVAQVMEVSVAWVYLAKHRVSGLLKREVAKLESEMNHPRILSD